MTVDLLRQVGVSVVQDSDEILPVATAHELKRLLPKAELNIFEACGHLPQVERMEKFCDVVSSFAK